MSRLARAQSSTILARNRISHTQQRPQALSVPRKAAAATDSSKEETHIPGVHVAGDVSRDVLMIAIAIAIAEGVKAAVAINKSLMGRDGFS